MILDLGKLIFRWGGNKINISIMFSPIVSVVGIQKHSTSAWDGLGKRSRSSTHEGLEGSQNHEQGPAVWKCTICPAEGGGVHLVCITGSGKGGAAPVHVPKLPREGGWWGLSPSQRSSGPCRSWHGKVLTGRRAFSLQECAICLPSLPRGDAHSKSHKVQQ